MRQSLQNCLECSVRTRLNLVASGDRIVKTFTCGRHTTKRSIAEQINLYVPEEKVKAFCQAKQYGNYDLLKSAHRPGLLNSSDVEIVSTYNAELRGFANYYRLACNVKSKLNRLFYLAHYSLFKTLADKHQKSLKAITQIYTSSRTELLNRLNARKCEYCGIDTGYFEAHHVRKLADIKSGKTKWEKQMIARNRKTMVLCIECHRQLTSGELPSWKQSIYSKVESRVN